MISRARAARDGTGGSSAPKATPPTAIQPMTQATAPPRHPRNHLSRNRVIVVRSFQHKARRLAGNPENLAAAETCSRYGTRTRLALSPIMKHRSAAIQSPDRQEFLADLM